MIITNSILPPNENEMQRTIEQIGKQILESFDTSKLSVNPVDCDSLLLPHLALAFDTDIEGLDEEEQRSLLQNSREIKRYIGSKYAVRKAVESIYQSNARAVPFYEYDGEPGKYKIEVDVTDYKPVTQENLLKTKKVVEAAQRESCVFEGFVISIGIHSQAKFKMATISSETILILPKRVENISLDIRQKVLVASHNIEIAYIKPKEGV